MAPSPCLSWGVVSSPRSSPDSQIITIHSFHRGNIEFLGNQNNYLRTIRQTTATTINYLGTSGYSGMQLVIIWKIMK